MLATALVSMWISNTATTVMMLPIGLSVVSAALSGIFRTALYLYAAEGRTPEGFTPDYVQNAFAMKAKTASFALSRG